MVAEAQSVDPYTSVAEVLKESPACRRGLQASTNLDLGSIEVALSRFERLGSVSKYMKGGEEYFQWKEPELLETTKRAIQKLAANPPDPLKHRLPKGWTVPKIVDEFVKLQADGADVSMPLVYDWMLKKYSDACEKFTAGSLRTMIAIALRDHEGITKIARDEEGVRYCKGSVPAVPVEVCGCGRTLPHGGRCSYRREHDPSLADNLAVKRREAEAEQIDLARVESLLAAGLSFTEVAASLCVSLSTFTRHRKSNPRLERAIQVGIQRHQHLSKMEEEDQNEAVDEIMREDEEKISARREGNQSLSNPANKISVDQALAKPDGNITESITTKSNGRLVELNPEVLPKAELPLVDYRSVIEDLKQKRAKIDNAILALEELCA